MPRVKSIRAEVGTTGEFYCVDVTQSERTAIADAVEFEHSCSDNHCDIAYALRNGYPHAAAYLLSGATETPLLDAVCQFYGFNPSGTDIPDWDEYVERFRADGVECVCGSFVMNDEGTQYVCDNCGSSLPTETED